MQVLLLALFFLFVCDEVRSQCYVNSDIAIHWSQLPGGNPFQEDSDQCLANYTIFNEDHIDDSASKGVNCSKRDSTATDGAWTYEADGTVVNCSDNTGEIRCERGPGSVTLYTAFGCSGCPGRPYPNGIYTCCIEGSCISIRVYQQDDLIAFLPNISNAVIGSCSIIPPSDVTIIPQQYIVQMITSGVPPIRLLSNIDCTSNCDSTTFGESYYTLIDLAEERYQYSRPVTWSPDTCDPNPQYSCRAVFSTGISGDNFLSTVLNTSIIASAAPTISYEVINATAIRIYWSITGDVNGFLINITSSGLPTVTQQLTDGSARGFIYDGILPERNYSIEVRGYYQLVGPASTITVRLEAGINFVELNLLSVSNDLNTQHTEVSCFTFRVNPCQVTWKIDSELIKPDSTYLRMNDAELLNSVNQTYRHYISLNGSFSNGTIISCSTTVNEETEVEEYVLQVSLTPPTGLSARIFSYSFLFVSWSLVSDANGYILQYSPNDETLLVNGSGSLFANTRELTQGATYQINVYSYRDLPSESSVGISVLYDVPSVAAVTAQNLTPRSVMIFWIVSNYSIIDNFTVSYICLCDNVRGSMLLENGISNSTVLGSLYPGLQYSISITAANLLGRGMERTVTVTLEESGPPTGAPLLQNPVLISSTAVSISWEEVSCTQRNGVIIGYSVQYNEEGEAPLTVNASGVTSIVIAGLTEFRMYFIRVAAINNNGIGPYSNASNFYTDASASSGPNSAVVAVGAAIGSIVFLALIIVVVVLVLVVVLRRKKLIGKNQTESICYSKDKPGEDYLEMNEPKKPLVHEDYQGSVPSPYDPMIPETFPVPVNDFGLYVSKSHSNMNSGFREQFLTLYTGEEKSCAIGQGDQYKLLNRFKNITVYDGNRIVLGDLPIKVDHNEFINGNYIHGYSVPRKYIATQGPLPRTVSDFWHMVWQEKVQFIVMLTNLMEDKKKCAPYWPEEVNSSETYGHFIVTCLEEEPLLHFVVRTLNVELKGTSNSVIIKHYQYITWPDHGVPESVSPFMTLNRRVMNAWSKDKGPIIVHCSAGVGRTGTFISVDMALEQAEKERKVDIAGIVCKLREQRMKMVQTDAQYAFIHDAVLEAVVVGSTEIPVELFEAKVRSWRQPGSLTGTTPIQTQFQLLDLVTPNPNDVIRQTAEKFPNKNRLMQFLPSEKWRVLLRGESPDYIHATFIHGYREKKAFILAQSPMENTAEDFWKMIMSYKVSAIVMCCGEQENEWETCFPYWDDNTSICFDYLVVEVISVTKRNGFIQRDLKISDKSSTMNVTQFQFTNWPESGVFKEPQVILQVLDDIGKIQRRCGKGPVVVHCSDTVGRSGVFCTVSNAIEQFKAETLVDVFQATKAVRMHKPGAVTTLEQYDFIHDIILRYLEQNSSYSNFQGNF